jgi:hypothetical protein
MNKIKTLIAILLTVFTQISITGKAFSQAASPQSISFQKGRFLSIDGRKVKFYRIIVDGNVCRYQVNPGVSYQEIAIKNIAEIDKETGNKALLYGFIFGLSGFAGGYLGVAESNSDLGSLGSVSNNTKTITIASTTALGVLIGVIFGASQKQYSTVYNNGKLIGGLNANTNINLVFNNNQKGLAIRYNF